MKTNFFLWNNRRTEEYCKHNRIEYFTNEWLLVIPITITQIPNFNFNFIYTFCTDWFFGCWLLAVCRLVTLSSKLKNRAYLSIEMNAYNMYICINMPKNLCLIELNQVGIFHNFLFTFSRNEKSTVVPKFLNLIFISCFLHFSYS